MLFSNITGSAWYRMYFGWGRPSAAASRVGAWASNHRLYVEMFSPDSDKILPVFFVYMKNLHTFATTIER